MTNKIIADRFDNDDNNPQRELNELDTTTRLTNSVLTYVTTGKPMFYLHKDIFVKSLFSALDPLMK